jgi:hypothetical protein
MILILPKLTKLKITNATSHTKLPKFDEVQTFAVKLVMFEPHQIYEVLCVMLH